MSVQAPTSQQIDAVRERADRFVADLDEEFYLHYSGQKETLDVEQVYERYEELTRFTCEGFLGNLTRAHQARLAREEAGLEATVDGRTYPYRMLRVEMSNE